MDGHLTCLQIFALIGSVADILVDTHFRFYLLPHVPFRVSPFAMWFGGKSNSAHSSRDKH